MGRPIQRLDFNTSEGKKFSLNRISTVNREFKGDEIEGKKELRKLRGRLGHQLRKNALLPVSGSMICLKPGQALLVIHAVSIKARRKWEDLSSNSTSTEFAFSKGSELKCHQVVCTFVRFSVST